jgi:hypothetical protein
MRIYRSILVIVALVALAVTIPVPQPETLIYFDGTAVGVQP